MGRFARNTAGGAGADPTDAGRGARRLRLVLVALWACLCLGGVGTVFWYQDWRYALPTPVPADHRAPAVGERVGRPAAIAAALGPAAGRPAVLHFFNPDCPCSRFNLDHLRDLVRDFAGRVDFALVVQLDPERTAHRAPDGLDLPVVLDADGSIADHYGVYATPTAAVVAADGTLAYVGNYTSSRYCVDPAEQYARLALEAVLGDRAPPAALGAPTPFGCSLPSDAPPLRSSTADPPLRP
jgi:hypothetical protein